MISVAGKWCIFAQECPNIVSSTGEGITAKRISAMSGAGIWGLIALSAEGCRRVISQVGGGIGPKRFSIGNIRDWKTGEGVVGIAC